MVSRNLAGSTPMVLAKATVSASTPRRPTIQLLTTSLRRLPAPASPSQTVLFPTASKTCSLRSLTSSGPEARTTSWPCSAGCFVPRTGASTSTAPWRCARSAQRSVPSMPIVDIYSQRTPSRAPGRARWATSSTASASGSIVRTASRPPTAAARSSPRLQGVTSRPASARRAAIGAPIVPPAPRTATERTGATSVVGRLGAQVGQRAVGVPLDREVADRHDARRAAVLEDRDAPDVLVADEADGVLDGLVDGERGRVGGADLGDLRARRVLAGRHRADGDVAVGDDPGDPALVGDQHGADVVLRHRLRRVGDRRVGRHGARVGGHDLADALRHGGRPLCSLSGSPGDFPI